MQVRAVTACMWAQFMLDKLCVVYNAKVESKLLLRAAPVAQLAESSKSNDMIADVEWCYLA